MINKNESNYNNLKENHKMNTMCEMGIQRATEFTLMPNDLSLFTGHKKTSVIFQKE